MPFQPPPGAPPPAANQPPVHQTTALPPPGAQWAQPAPVGIPTLTAGTLLTRTLEVWWHNLGKLVLLSLVMFAPILVVMVALFGAAFAMGVMDGSQADPARLLPAFGAGLVAMVLVVLPLAMIMLGGINYGVIRWLAGQEAGVGDMLRQGARRVWGLVLAGLLVVLAILGGYLLLIVPGIMIAVATCVALPAATVERVGAVDAFKRSLELTRGYRWPIFAAFLLLGLLNVAFSVVGMIFNLIPFLGALVSLGLSLVTATMPYVMPAVAYHDLRVAKEGVDTSQLARVFE